MDKNLLCYRCGESLFKLSLPLSRQDECPSCAISLHVCRMCRHFDPTVTRQCKEDGADDVQEKARPNFCDWFEPNYDAYDDQEKKLEDRARSELDVLFGGSSGGVDVPEGPSDAEKLFK